MSETRRQVFSRRGPYDTKVEEIVAYLTCLTPSFGTFLYLLFSLQIHLMFKYLIKY